MFAMTASGSFWHHQAPKDKRLINEQEIFGRPLVRLLNRIPMQAAREWRNQLIFQQQYLIFKEALQDDSRNFPMENCDKKTYFEDATAGTNFDAHYIYHTAWAARQVRRLGPPLHIDISSSLYFSSILSAFIPTEFYDYRPADLHLDNLACKRADLMSLPFDSNSVESLTCMHVIEHIGLGRYGDPLDAKADLKAIREIHRVLKPGGVFLFVVPIGTARIVFHAHRIYSLRMIQEMLDGFTIREFSMVPDDPRGRGMLNYPQESVVDEQRYACGCFKLTKD